MVQAFGAVLRICSLGFMLEKKSLIINYFGGSYGNFVHTFITGNLKEDKINLLVNNFHNNSKEFSTLKIVKTHNNEKVLDQFNLKITYEKHHIDLISRNVWKKNQNHLIEKTDELFKNYEEDIDDVEKKIITIAFYKNNLLHGLKDWNKILKQSTLELPMYYFLADKEHWLLCWKKIFKNLSFNASDQYIIDAYYIFKKTQQSLIEEHNFYGNVEWSKQDLIGKGNYIGELYYHKHSQKTIPIDVIKYKDTKHMLSQWIAHLDTTHAQL